MFKNCIDDRIVYRDLNYKNFATRKMEQQHLLFSVKMFYVIQTKPIYNRSVGLLLTVKLLFHFF